MKTEASKYETYPRAFVEWLLWGDHPYVSVLDEVSGYFTDEMSDERYNVQQLYGIWLNEDEPEELFNRLADIIRPVV